MPVSVTPQANPPGTVPAPVSAPPAPAHNPPEQPDYRQQYQVLKGKYDAEVPRLHQEKQQAEIIANQALTQNQQLIQELQMRSRPQQPAPAAPKPLVTDEERETYGADLVDLIGRRAVEAVLPLVDQRLQTQLQPLRHTVTQAAQQSSQQAAEGVYRVLDAQVPNWAAVNNSPEFGAWLKMVEPFSGQSRQAAITQAFNSFDAGRVVAIFLAFLRENAPGAASSGAPIAAETLLAPGQSLGGNPGVAPGSGGKRIYAESEIQAFYNAVRHKKVSPEEYAAFQVEVAAAAKEGRIRPTKPQFGMNQ